MSGILYQGVSGVADESEKVKALACTKRGRALADLRARSTDKLREECGVMAIHGHPEAARQAYLGLYALQHRGQESAGIATADGQRLANIKGMGLVSEIFTEDVLAKLPTIGKDLATFSLETVQMFRRDAEAAGFEL